MTRAWFSVFFMVERHPIAGVMLSDVTTGEEHWVMDLGLEASMSPDNPIAIRLFKPADFACSSRRTSPSRQVWRSR